MAWKFNPFTMQLDYYEEASTTPIVTFKTGVANVDALPLTGNTTNDARIVNDTHNLYVWSGTAWIDQGDIFDVDWSSIANKPSSSANDIDTAVGITQDLTSGIEIILDGAGGAISTGIKGDFQVPFACEIQEAVVLADQTGSIQIDIWKDTFANFPPTNDDSITDAAPMVISSATSSQDTTLTGWTKTLAAGSILRFNVDSCDAITRCTVILKIKRT